MYKKTIILPIVLAGFLVSLAFAFNLRQEQQSTINQHGEVLAAFSGGTLSFDRDAPLCKYEAGPVTAYIRYTIQPADAQATLQMSWRVINPPSKATETYYASKTVSGSGQELITAQWPGIEPGDTLVEIHFGAALLNPTTGQPVVTEGLDYYWYPWVCAAPTDSPPDDDPPPPPDDDDPPPPPDDDDEENDDNPPPPDDDEENDDNSPPPGDDDDDDTDTTEDEEIATTATTTSNPVPVTGTTEISTGLFLAVLMLVCGVYYSIYSRDFALKYFARKASE